MRSPDHRSAAPSGNQLHSMAAESRVGGLGGKTRCQRFSYGQQQKGLQPLYDILENSDADRQTTAYPRQP